MATTTPQINFKMWLAEMEKISVSHVARATQTFVRLELCEKTKQHWLSNYLIRDFDTHKFSVISSELGAPVYPVAAFFANIIEC